MKLEMEKKKMSACGRVATTWSAQVYPPNLEEEEILSFFFFFTFYLVFFLLLLLLLSFYSSPSSSLSSSSPVNNQLWPIKSLFPPEGSEMK